MEFLQIRSSKLTILSEHSIFQDNAYTDARSCISIHIHFILMS
jgi:hypothetical protein